MTTFTNHYPDIRIQRPGLPDEHLERAFRVELRYERWNVVDAEGMIVADCAHEYLAELVADALNRYEPEEKR